MSLLASPLPVAGALAVLILAALAPRGWRRVMARRQPPPSPDAHLTGLSQVLERLETRQTEMLDRVETMLEAIRVDLEWLAGDRMIEQASAMVRTGAPAEQISAELGLSLDTVRTIALFRPRT